MNLIRMSIRRSIWMVSRGTRDVAELAQMGDAPHVPVLLRPIIAKTAPISGTWLDGTFGAGGYTRALLDAGADTVIAVDQDPLVFDMAKSWADEYGARLVPVASNFANLDKAGQNLDGIVLDLGVSSMQIDQAERGFSFMQDGPLDMRMSQSDPTAADLVNTATEAELADILFQYGEERASRRIAKAIIAARPLNTTAELVAAITEVAPVKKGQSHPATRSFQALRIAVNDELGALIRGLEAAERALAPNGWLAVVTFHSLEDRIVKRFLQSRSAISQGSRYAPEQKSAAPTFELQGRKAIKADDEEVAANPRARSASLRLAKRTTAAARPSDWGKLGLPGLVFR